jgi:hypothetical protein
VGGNRAARTAVARVACAAGAVVALGIAASACGSDDAPDSSDVDPAAAYAAIVEWQAGEQEPIIDDNGEVQLPVIYVAAADGDTIDVGVQADVAESTVDIATVRFTDDKGDAFDGDLDDQPVREDGVMLLVGPMPDPGPSVLVDVTRYSSVDRSEPFQLKITQPSGTPGSVGERAPVTVVTRL